MGFIIQFVFWCISVHAVCREVLGAEIIWYSIGMAWKQSIESEDSVAWRMARRHVSNIYMFIYIYMFNNYGLSVKRENMADIWYVRVPCSQILLTHTIEHSYFNRLPLPMGRMAHRLFLPQSETSFDSIPQTKTDMMISNFHPRKLLQLKISRV